MHQFVYIFFTDLVVHLAILDDSFCLFLLPSYPHPPIDSIMRLMTVWMITGKIIRTTIMLITYAPIRWSYYNFGFS